MCDHTKFQQNWPDGFGYIAIFRFSRWLPSAILDFENLKFLLTVILGSLICITIPNYIKIGQMVADMSHSTVFKMA